MPIRGKIIPHRHCGDSVQGRGSSWEEEGRGWVAPAIISTTRSWPPGGAMQEECHEQEVMQASWSKGMFIPLRWGCTAAASVLESWIGLVLRGTGSSGTPDCFSFFNCMWTSLRGLWLEGSIQRMPANKHLFTGSSDKHEWLKLGSSQEGTATILDENASLVFQRGNYVQLCCNVCGQLHTQKNLLSHHTAQYWSHFFSKSSLLLLSILDHFHRKVCLMKQNITRASINIFYSNGKESRKEILTQQN